MPGICGFVDKSGLGDSAAILAEMLDRLQHEEWYTRESDIEAAHGVALGRVSLGFVNRGRQPVSIPEASASAVMDGELYNAAELRFVLEQAGQRCTSDSHAEILLRGYLAEGQRFFQRVNGYFSAALWDGRHRRLILTNDKFGMRPLYYAQSDERMLFGSEIKALLVDPTLPRAPNPRGIVQFFSYGQLWENDTFYEAVRVLPAAAWVIYEADADQLTVDRYWRLKPPPTAFAATEADMLDRLDHLFRQAVETRLETDRQIGISLSGGMDSRTLLAAMDQRRHQPICVSMGMDGNQDHLRARQMARLAGCRHEGYILDEQFLSRYDQHLARMVALTDGHYLCQCIVMPTLPFYRKLGIEVLFRGHAGELLHLQKAYNFSHDAEALRIQDSASLEKWLFRRLRAYMLDGLDEPLFDFASPQEVEALARESLRDSLRDTADWPSQTQRIGQMFISQRLRRETAMSMVEFHSVAETRLPYLDADLMEAIFSTPPELRLGDKVQTHMLQRQFPAFLNVINVNTGAKVGAGRLARTWGKARQKVLAKLGVKGYQPYERLGLWLRRELRPLVRDILLDERCLQRGIFRPDTVRKVVEQHLTQRRNHTYLIMAMMILESGQRASVGQEFPTPQACSSLA